jgi:hypothetical protein
MKVETYLLGHRPSEQDRLQHQAEFLVDEASVLFDQIRLASLLALASWRSVAVRAAASIYWRSGWARTARSLVSNRFCSQ